MDLRILTERAEITFQHIYLLLLIYFAIIYLILQCRPFSSPSPLSWPRFGNLWSRSSIRKWWFRPRGGSTCRRRRRTPGGRLWRRSPSPLGWSFDPLSRSHLRSHLSAIATAEQNFNERQVNVQPKQCHHFKYYVKLKLMTHIILRHK